MFWMPLDTHHPSKHCCGPRTPHHHNNTTWWQWPPSRTTCTETLQTLLRNSSGDTIKGLRCWSSLQIPQIPIWSSICRTCWSRSDPSRPHPSNIQDPLESTMKCPGARHQRTPSKVLNPCLVRSELFWSHKRNLHNNRQVVIMLCLITIHIYLHIDIPNSVYVS